MDKLKKKLRDWVYFCKVVDFAIFKFWFLNYNYTEGLQKIVNKENRKICIFLGYVCQKLTTVGKATESL